MGSFLQSSCEYVHEHFFFVNKFGVLFIKSKCVYTIRSMLVVVVVVVVVLTLTL